MHHGYRWALGLLIVLAPAAGEARAQFYGGYGNYGWGGWGGGGTVQGSIARGLGYYNMGAGMYNAETAQANAINADTIMRWNQYMFQAQQEANRREYLRRARLTQRDAAAGEAMYKRARDNPDDHAIANGDALNAILTQLTDPKVHSTVLRMIKTPVPGKAIREIPFENASEAVTLSLDELTGESDWPAALQGPAFAVARKAYQEAIDRAVKEDEEGALSAQTMQDVDLAMARLRARLEENKPPDKIQYVEALNHLKALMAMTRMLQKPEVDKILAELDTVKETSLGSLLAFMHAYNLRFGPPINDAQRTVYRNLYPIMDEARDKVLGDEEASKASGNPPLARDDRHPVDFFSGLHLEHLENRSGNKPTNP